jgi:hypothetical protein
MALLQNQTINAQYPRRLMGGVNGRERAMFGRAERRNVFFAEGWSQKSGVPSGHLAPSSWTLPQKPGGMSSHNSAAGVATATGSIAAGRNIAGAASGAATASATGQLVVSGVGSAAGVATVSGNVTAALGAIGAAAGSATATGALTAKGNIAGASAGVATASAIRYATGALSGSIAPAITLEASAFSAYLLDEEDVETGMTLRQALRLIAAATAGKVSGAGTSTITIRNAVADGANRIVATVDSNGNRTAISYTLD